MPQHETRRSVPRALRPPLKALTIHFQPQADLPDNSFIDIAGGKTYDAAKAALGMTAAEFRRVAKEILRDGPGRDFDELASRTRGVISGHRGPFSQSLEPDDFRAWLDAVGFDPDDLDNVDDATMAKMRAEYGVREYRPMHQKKVGALQMQDWRIAEGECYELSEMQKKPWNAKIVEGGYLGGLDIEIVAPDGTKRFVAFEIDKGNLKIIPYGDKDEPDVILHLTSAGTHLSLQQAHPSEPSDFIIGEATGHVLKRVDDGPVAGFVDDEPTAGPKI